MRAREKEKESELGARARSVLFSLTKKKTLRANDSAVSSLSKPLFEPELGWKVKVKMYALQRERNEQLGEEKEGNENEKMGTMLRLRVILY